MYRPLDGTTVAVRTPPTNMLEDLYLKTNPGAKRKQKGTKRFFDTPKPKK